MHEPHESRGRDAAARQGSKKRGVSPPTSASKVDPTRGRIADPETLGFQFEPDGLLNPTGSRSRRLGQAAALDARQQRALLTWVTTTRDPMRNEVMARLSFECGLRATEIGRVRWWMAYTPSGHLRSRLQLHATATKGGYGSRALVIVPAGLGAALDRLRAARPAVSQEGFVIRFRKGSIDPIIRSSAVQAFFRQGYDAIGCLEASSHSGRRTAITQMARALGLKNAQVFAGHRSLATTARYEEPDYAAIDRVVAERLVVQVPRKLSMAKASLRVMTQAAHR